MRKLKQNIIVSGGDRNTFNVSSAETASFTSNFRGGGTATFLRSLHLLPKRKIAFLFMLLIANQLAKSQCTFTPPFPGPVCNTNANVALNGYASPSGGVFTGTGVISPIPPSTVYYFNPSAAGQGVHTIAYITTSPVCTTTQNITVVASLSITPAPPSYVLTSGSSTSVAVVNPSGYKSYYWYENGVPVPGTNTSTTSITVSRMGTFTVLAEGPCGSEKAEIEITCDCSSGDQTYASGYTFLATNPASIVYISGSPTAHSTTDYVFGNTIFISKGTEVHIDNANIDMKACTKIVLEAGDINNDGGILRVGANVRLRGCDKWLGIIVNGDPTISQSSGIQSFLYIASQTAEVSDAYIAVYSENGGNLRLENGIYSNNNTHIALMNNNQGNDYNPVIKDNIFKSLWLHDNTFSCSLTDYSAFVNSTNKTSNKKMIYIEDCKDFNIYDCTFDGNDFLSGNNYITNAIELFDIEKINLGGTTSGPALHSLYFTGLLNSGIFATNVSNFHNTTASPIYSNNSNYIFDRYFFDDDVKLDKAIVLNNCSTIYLGYVQAVPYNANQFLGEMNYGSFVSNSYEIYQRENIFNVTDLTSSTALSSNIGTCMYYENSTEVEITANIMADIGTGCHLENCTSLCNVTGNRIYSPIKGLEILSCNDIDIISNEITSSSNIAGYFEDCNAGAYINGNQITGGYDGFHFKDCDDINIASNDFDGCANYTVQYYGDGGTMSNIDGNRFLNGQYGLIISPSQDPITATGGLNTGATNITFSCNLFRNNNYAILGSGDIPNQGNSTVTSGNEFRSSVPETWELVWEFGGVSSFDYYINGTGSNPNAYGSLAPNPGITLNGTLFNTPLSDFGKIAIGNDPACFGTLQMAFRDNSSKRENENDVRVLNHLINDELNINLININSYPNIINCFDALGRKHELILSNYENGICKYNSSRLAAGVYYVYFNNLPLKFYKIDK